MRHTLLPLHDRIVLRREYYIRVLIILCFMLSISILVGVVSLFPTFIKVVMEENQGKSGELSVTKASKNQNLSIVQEKVVRSLALLNSLKNEDNTPKISNLIKGVLNNRNGLNFTSISASKVGTTTFTMTVQGIAPTRASLLSFKSNFESLAPNNKVDLPVSALSKSSNIQFSLLIKEKMP